MPIPGVNVSYRNLFHEKFSKKNVNCLQFRLTLGRILSKLPLKGGFTNVSRYDHCCN